MQPIQSPGEHYAEAQRLLAALPSHGLTVDQTLIVESARALAHAIMSTCNPRHVRRSKPGPSRQRPAGGSPTTRWVYGDDEPEGGTP
jgi:hypothetical protein